MPGPVFQTFTTSTYTGAAATSHPIPINKPSGLSNGDTLFVTIALRQDDGVGRTLNADPTFGSGFPWAKVSEGATYNTSGQANRVWTYVRYVANAASEPANYTFTVTYASAFAIIACSVTARFSNAGPIRPIDASAPYVDTALVVTYPQVTTTLPDTILIYSGYARNIQTSLTFSSATLISIVGVTLTTTISAGMGYKIQSATGLTAVETGTWSGGGGTTVSSTTAALATDFTASTAWIRA